MEWLWQISVVARQEPHGRRICARSRAPERGEVLTWIAGAWMLRTLKERMFSDPLNGKQHRPISSYRCIRCGYLEVYAK
jgi:hypothetical protein